MTKSLPSSPRRRRQVLVEALHRVESFLGLLGTWFFGMMSGFALVVIAIDEGYAQRQHALAAGPLFRDGLVVATLLLLLTIHIPLFAATWRAFTALDPFALAAARYYGRWTLPMRPIAAGWWLAHFAFISFGAIMLEVGPHASSRVVDDAAAVGRALPLGAIIPMVFVMTLANNAFLLLAVGSITQRPTVLRAVWRMRLLIDLILSLLPLAFAR